MLPFHRAVVDDPAFTATTPDGFTVHTRRIETEFAAELEPFDGGPQESDPHTVTIEIGGRWHEVRLPGLFATSPATSTAIIERARERRARGAAAVHGDDVTAPM